jgi:hypothetical protein
MTDTFDNTPAGMPSGFCPPLNPDGCTHPGGFLIQPYRLPKDERDKLLKNKWIRGTAVVVAVVAALGTIFNRR